MKTAVQERSVTDVEDVRAFLRLNTADHDPLLEHSLAAAKELADGYLCNDFLTSSGAPAPIPQVVELWLKRFCATVFSHPKLGVKQKQTVNLGSEALLDVYNEVYNATYSDLKMRRKLPGISTR